MKIIFGVMASGASGSQGGITASHNRFGPYLRSRTVPVNPNSSRQQAARTNFSAAAEFWSNTLTQLQRDAWNQYAAAIAWVGSLGQTVYLTGFNMFIRSMTATLASGLPDVADGPTILTLPESDPTFSVSISEATQLITVTFDEALAWVDEDDAGFAVSMGSPKGAGRQFLGGPFRLGSTLLGDGTTPLTTPQTMTAPFLVAENQKVDVFARIIRADGRVSAPFWDSAIIAA